MYTIRIQGEGSVFGIVTLLRERAQREGFTFREATSEKSYRRKPVRIIELQQIRLLKKKPYCGNHPGSCPVGTKKPNATYLEWDDWVKFHNIVNDVLDADGRHAVVWSEPTDVRGRMWIRRDNKRRKRYSWKETYSSGLMRPLRIWNRGDKDDEYI